MVMDQLEELYFIAFSCNCFEAGYKRGVCDVLDFQQTHIWENGDTDSTLLAFTIVQKLYQRLKTVHCPYLRIIADCLVSKNYLVDGLLKYLGHRNQHVVFSATKAIVLVLQALPKQMIKVEWFQALFDFGQEIEQPWRKLYTMELLKKVLKNSRELTSVLKNTCSNENSQQQINNQTCSCLHKTDSMFDTTFPSTELAELLLGCFNLEHILFYFIPFIVRPSGMYSFMRSCRHVGPAEDFVVLRASLKLGDAIHDQENLKREAIGRTKENNLVAFLHCVMEAAKYLKTDSICETEMEITHIKETSVNQLCTVMATLVQYLHYPRLPSLIFKKILEVLNQVLVLPSSFLSTQKDEYTKLEKILRSSSISFLSVVECCLLRKIPRCSGHVGFSGSDVKSSPGSTDNKHSSADLVALRNTSLMVFKSSFVVLKSAAKKEGSLLLQKSSLSCVSMWCSGIMSLTPDANNKSTDQSSNESEFHRHLVALFVDQDDDLVEVMLLLLLLFQEIHRTVSSSEISTNILRQLNPHLLFISFAESIEFDHSLLLDLLISSETRFLEYLVQYLHVVTGGWNLFIKCLATYKERSSCSEEEEEETTSDDLKTCRLHLSEFESDYNSFEKRTEFKGGSANELHVHPMENDSLFAGQEKLDAEEDFVMKDDTQRLSPRRVVAGEHRCGSQLVSWPQSNSSERCCNNLCGDLSETNSELCQPNFHHVGNQGSEQSGLKSIVLAYCSSDESDVEIEDENENANETRSDSDCSTNNKLDWLSLKNANGTETFESFFTNKSCSGFPSNQPVCAPDCNVLSDGYPGHDSSFPSGTKVLLSSDKDTEVCGNSYENHDGSFDNPTGGDSNFPSGTKLVLSSDKDTEVGCENLDQIMTMLIRLRMSVVRLSSSGHFPYSAAPLIALMERVEKCYDGC